MIHKILHMDFLEDSTFGSDVSLFGSLPLMDSLRCHKLICFLIIGVCFGVGLFISLAVLAGNSFARRPSPLPLRKVSLINSPA